MLDSTIGPSGHGDEVLLRLPAQPESLAVARTVAAAVASQWGFALDVVDDARLIVSELLTLVLQAKPGCPTQITFEHADSRLQVTLQTDASVPAPTPESFGWLVVSELSSELGVRSDDSGLTITAALTGVTGG